MPRIVVLNSVTHGHLKVRTDYGADLGYAVSNVPVITAELPRLVCHYPVLLGKNPETGQFFLSILLGFEGGENLFLDPDKGWAARYLPLQIERLGFHLGKGDEPDSIALAIEEGHPRFSDSVGDNLFTADSQLAQATERMTSVMVTLFQGQAETDGFVSELARLELIESTRIQFSLPDGKRFDVEGIYTVSKEKLANLSGSELEAFWKTGHAERAHMMVASLGHLGSMIDEKARRA